MTTYEDVVNAFESIIKSKYVLADGLVEQWFKNAVGEYELNIGKLGYDADEMGFLLSDGESTFFDSKGNLSNHVILNLAELMKSYYMQQERRRVNQLNNIIGKDISLNGKFSKLNLQQFNDFLNIFFRLIKEWKNEEYSQNENTIINIRIVEKDNQYDFHIYHKLPSNFDSFLDLVHKLH